MDTDGNGDSLSLLSHHADSVVESATVCSEWFLLMCESGCGYQWTRENELQGGSRLNDCRGA